MIALQKVDSVYTDLKIGEITGSEEEDSSSKSSTHYEIWDHSKIKELVNGKRDICLKTIRRQYVAEAERQAICKALELTRWNRKKAAKLLQVSYKTVLNRIEEFKLVK
jgi:DNA-binding NtrC family response regulator